MNIIDLKNKVQKAEEAVEKAQKTIERHMAQMEKKLKVIVDRGWNPEDRYCREGTAEYNESYWAICEYESKRSDVRSANLKLKDKIRILNNWKERLAAAEEKEYKFLVEVPECMKAMMQELIAEWNEYDLNRREAIKKDYQEMEYRAFADKYQGTGAYNLMWKTVEQVQKENERDAKGLILNLYSRVNAITGDVTDWDNIHYGGKALNGYVYGKLGAVRVESILAGGYNIQRLHIRVLVHEI